MNRDDATAQLAKKTNPIVRLRRGTKGRITGWLPDCNAAECRGGLIGSPQPTKAKAARLGIEHGRAEHSGHVLYQGFPADLRL